MANKLYNDANIKGIAEELSSERNIILVGISLVLTSLMLKLGTKRQNSKKYKSY